MFLLVFEDISSHLEVTDDGLFFSFLCRVADALREIVYKTIVVSVIPSVYVSVRLSVITIVCICTRKDAKLASPSVEMRIENVAFEE